MLLEGLKLPTGHAPCVHFSPKVPASPVRVARPVTHRIPPSATGRFTQCSRVETRLLAPEIRRHSGYGSRFYYWGGVQRLRNTVKVFGADVALKSTIRLVSVVSAPRFERMGFMASQSLTRTWECKC